MSAAPPRGEAGAPDGPGAPRQPDRPAKPALPPLLRPQWPAPASVQAAMSLRGGGVGAAPFDSLNLGGAVGDAPQAVAENRRRFAAALGAEPVWLRQVHGATVLRLGAGDTDAGALPPADAAWTDAPRVACAVLVADCLPVLLCRRDGRAVAAAHAGWRGLSGGVLEATVQALCDGTRCAARDLLAWIGPGIGPQRFEVGADVLQAFGAPGQGDPAFAWRPRADGSPRWLADLPVLARRRLQACGVGWVGAHGGCTFGAASDFFSFRRDGRTGRMAAAIWLRG